jgi:hypothetical protein
MKPPLISESNVDEHDQTCIVVADADLAREQLLGSAHFQTSWASREDTHGTFADKRRHVPDERARQPLGLERPLISAAQAAAEYQRPF